MENLRVAQAFLRTAADYAAQHNTDQAVAISEATAPAVSGSTVSEKQKDLKTVKLQVRELQLARISSPTSCH